MRNLLSVLTLCLLLITGAAAQETRGNISGTVQDAQGVVPGATVKITNVDTNTTQVLVTNNTGYFEAPLLQPGTYRIVVEMASFKTITRDGVALAVGQQINIPFTLEVGSINEQVTVTGIAPVLDTTSVSSGANFDSELVKALPLFSNMPIGLARFAPGVNPDADQPPMSQGFVTGPSEAAGSAIGGVGSNTYTIDGATNAGVNRQLSTSPNADMIQEMRVETSNFDASNGHGLGNQISMMTRAGTNATRGTSTISTGRTSSTRSMRSKNRRSTMWRLRRSGTAARTTPPSRLGGRSTSQRSSTAAARRCSSPTTHTSTTRFPEETLATTRYQPTLMTPVASAAIAEALRR